MNKIHAQRTVYVIDERQLMMNLYCDLW